MKGRFPVSLLLAVALGGCSSGKTSLERASLGIEAFDANGRHAVVACEQLPLLQGSRRYTSHVIDDRLTIRVTAEPADVTLSFEDDAGKTLTKPRTIPRGALLHGYAEELDLALYDGGIYTLSLSSECLP